MGQFAKKGFSKEEHKIKRIKISRSLSITHLPFVDDVLLLGLGNVEEWKQYNNFIEVFCKVTMIMISKENSIFLHNNPNVGIRK